MFNGGHMNKRIPEQLSKIIGRLEDWQNNNHEAIAKTVGPSDINHVKSELLRALSKLETA